MMSDLMSSFLVPLYFIHITFAMAVLAWWFSTKKENVLKYFGWGMAGYALGVAIWTAVILTKPTDLEPAILLGVVPFLLAHLAYAKAATLKSKTNYVMILTLALMATTFVARTFFFPSQPYFSENGYFFFGLMAIPLALYIATISVSFLPAIRAVAGEIKNKSMQPIVSVGLTTVYVCMIIQISVADETVRLINGVVASAALLALWVKALATKKA